MLSRIICFYLCCPHIVGLTTCRLNMAGNHVITCLNLQASSQMIVLGPIQVSITYSKNKKIKSKDENILWKDKIAKINVEVKNCIVSITLSIFKCVNVWRNVCNMWWFIFQHFLQPQHRFVLSNLFFLPNFSSMRLVKWTIQGVQIIMNTIP